MDLNNVEHSWLIGYPFNWEVKRVKHIFYLSKSKVKSQNDYPILSLTMKGIKFRDVSTNEGQLPENFDGYTLLEKDDIVFNPMDLISGWVDKSNVQGLISPSYKVLRTEKENINRDYFKYFFQTHYTEKIFFPFGEGVHYQYRWGLGSQTLLNFPILIPPIKEQFQIVHFLDEKTELIDKLISTKEKKISLLKEQRTSLINQVVTKGLNPNVNMKDSGSEWIGEIPDGWGVFKMKYGVNHINEKGLTSEGDIKISPENVESMTGVCFNYFSEYDGEGMKFCKGDILLNKLRLYLKKIVLTDVEGYSMGEMIVLRCMENLFNRYFFYLIFHQGLIDLLDSQSNGVKLPRVSPEIIMNSLIPFPSLKEQYDIVEHLDSKTKEIDDLVHLEQKKIDLLKEYRKSLISEVVTGKIKVTTDE